MDPNHVRDEALLWLAAAAVILPVCTGFIIKFLGAISQIKAAVNDLRSRQDAQSKHLVSQQQQITSVALATQPAAPALPVDGNNAADKPR